MFLDIFLNATFKRLKVKKEEDQLRTFRLINFIKYLNLLMTKLMCLIKST